MISNLGHQSFQPGSVIREKDGNQDYIIQGVSTLGIGSGLVILASSFYGKQLKRFVFNSGHEFSDTFIHVRQNAINLTPDEVRQKLHEVASGFSKASKHLEENLKDPANQVFRDLLMIAADNDHDYLNKGILNLAEGLFNTSHAIPSKSSILNSLREIGSRSEYTDEFVGHLADKLHKEINGLARAYSRKSGAVGGGWLSADASNLIVPMFFGANSDNSTANITRFLELRNNTNKTKLEVQLDFVKKLTQEFQSDYHPEGLNSNALVYHHMLGLGNEANPKERLKSFLQRVHSFSSDDAESLVKNHFNFIVNSADKGEVTPFMKLMWEGMDMKQRAFLRLQHGLEKNPILKTRPSTKQINRATAYGRHQKTLTYLTKKLNLKRIEELDNTFVRVFDRTAFMDEILEGVELSSKNRTMNQTDLRKFFKDNIGDFVALSKDDVTAITKAKEFRSTVDVDFLLQQSKALKEVMGNATLNELGVRHSEYNLGSTIANPKSKFSAVKIKEGVSPEVLHILRTNDTNSVLDTIQPITNAQERLFHAQVDLDKAIDGQKLFNFYGKDYHHITEQLAQFHNQGAGGVVNLTMGTVDAGLMDRMAASHDVQTALHESSTDVKTLHFNIDTQYAMNNNLQAQFRENYLIRNNNAKRRIKSKRFLSTEDAWDSGYVSGKASVKSLRPRGSSGRITQMIVSDAGEDIEKQIILAQRFMDKNTLKYILDTEVNYRGSNPLIHDISIQGVKNSSHNFSKSRLYSPLERAEALISVTNQIDKIASKGGIVATQTGADFRWMMQSVYSLEDNFGNNEGMLKKLNRAKNILQKVSDSNQILDLTVVHQLAGNPSGQVSQQKIATKYGITEPQSHKAAADVSHAIDIVTNPDYIKDFQQGIKSLKSSNKPHLFLDRSGNILSSKAILETSGSGLVGVFDVHEFVTDVNGLTTLKANGMQKETSFKGLHQLGAYMHQESLGDLTTSEIQHKQMGVMVEWEERALRRIFSPESSWMFDSMGQTMTSGASTTLSVFKHTRDIMSMGAKDVYTKTLSERARKQGVFDVGLISTAEKNKIAHEVAVKQTAAYLGENKLASNQDFVERVTHHLKLAFTGDAESSIITGNNTLTRFIDSEAGKLMTSFADTSIINNDSGYFDVGMLFLKGKTMADKHFSQTPTTFRPRFSLNLGGIHISQNINSIQDITKMGRTVNSLSAQVILASRTEREHAASQNVINSVFGQERGSEIIKLSQDFANEHSLGLFDNEGFMDVAQKLLLISKKEDTKYGPLLDAVHQLGKSNEMEEAIGGLFKKQSSSGHTPLEAVQFGQALLAKAENEKSKHRGSLAYALESVTQRETHGSEQNIALFQQFFSQIKGTSLDIHSYGDDVAKLTSEQLTEFSTQVSKLGQEVGGEFSTIFHAITEQMHDVKDINDPDSLRKFKESLQGGNLIKTLAMEGNATRTGSTAQPVLEASMRLHNMVPKTGAGGLSGTIREVMQSINLKNTIPGIEGMGQMATPLMLVGGVAAIMGAFGPKQDQFSQGVQSDNYGFDTITRNSEIPGHEWTSKTYQGEEQPFRIDITFNGYIKDKQEHRRFTKQVFNSLSDHIEAVGVNDDFKENIDKPTYFQTNQVLRNL